MATYGDLQDRVQSELKRPDLSSEVRLAIKSAIQHYESERFYFSEGRAARNTEANKEYYPLPTDFQKADMITFVRSDNDRIPLQERQWSFIEEIQGNASTVLGEPDLYAQYASELRIYPVPDDEYRLEIAYVKNQTELSATADSNPWTNDAEELIRLHA